MENQVKVSNELEQRILDVFMMFDFNEEKTVEAQDVGIILRFLGCVPTEKEILAIVKATETEPKSGVIEAVEFIHYVQKLIREGKMKPNSPARLMKALQILNPQNKEFISREKLIEVFQNNGEIFSDQQMDCLLDSVLDSGTDSIDYLNYARHLIHEPKNSIYILAKKIEKEQELKANKEKKKRQTIRMARQTVLARQTLAARKDLN